MEETPSNESLSDQTPQRVSPRSPRPLEDPDSDVIREQPMAAVASGASTGAYPTPQQVREILLVLRPPEPAEETVNEDQTTSLTPDLEFRQATNEERPPTPSDERACLQLWVLWAALTLPLFFSMWLFLVPFVISSSSTTRWADRPTVTTPEPCLKPVQIREPSMPIRANLNGTLGPSKERARPVFCLFRNNAVTLSRNYSTVGQNYDYTFWSVPFELCHNVIYWSVAIDNGSVTSRMPSFDYSYGLHRLRNITDRLGYFNVKILLALGGYSEDGPHFSILGREPATLDRLTANVIATLNSFRLDGVTVHWVDPGPRCGSPGDQAIIAALLRALRQAFDNNGMTLAMVTAMLDGAASVERLISMSKDVVNYFFLTDHRRLASQSRDVYDVCATFSDNTILTLHHYLTSVPGLRRDQICAYEPVAALAVDGYIDAFHPICVLHRHQMNWGRPPHFAANVRAATIYFVDTTLTIYSRYNTSFLPPVVREPCVFLTLIELDNYAGQCGAKYNRYLLSQHVYSSTVHKYEYTGSVIDAAPPYTPDKC
ncbi:hypothetical protein HPB51_025186 [Rhipicephalus microplus]|uniref:GH18 domain-containing protein n=1 Tax=Rhipicephalus microplus TaxID=6941 RepID=A0A9J6EDF6_RHIMP|nr:hypothetical protein HPB51_025186 [Rhipicephalus microplus]